MIYLKILFGVIALLCILFVAFHPMDFFSWLWVKSKTFVVWLWDKIKGKKE